MGNSSALPHPVNLCFLLSSGKNKNCKSLFLCGGDGTLPADTYVYSLSLARGRKTQSVMHSCVEMRSHSDACLTALSPWEPFYISSYHSAVRSEWCVCRCVCVFGGGGVNAHSSHTIPESPETVINSSLAHAPFRLPPNLQFLSCGGVSKVNPGPLLLQYFCFHNFFSPGFLLSSPPLLFTALPPPPPSRSPAINFHHPWAPLHFCFQCSFTVQRGVIQLNQT